MRVPWTERRSNQSILKEINPEYSLKGLMLKLTLHYFADSNSGKFMLFIYTSRNSRKVDPMSLKSRIIIAQALTPGA